jgi:hypothetical protein
MVDKSISPLQTSFRLFFISGQSRQATFSCKKASSIDFCLHFPSPTRDDIAPTSGFDAFQAETGGKG